MIDRVVENKEFRQKLFDDEFQFVKKVADPVKCAEWWDRLFEDFTRKYVTIRKNSSPLRVKLRMIGFLITNRLYASKIKKVMSGPAHYKTGQMVYDNPSKKISMI